MCKTGVITVLLPISSGLFKYWGNTHREVGLSSDSKEPPCNAGDPSSITGLERPPAEGNGYLCLAQMYTPVLQGVMSGWLLSHIQQIWSTLTWTSRTAQRMGLIYLYKHLQSTYCVPETPPRTFMQGNHLYLYFTDKKLRLWENNEYVLSHTARKWQNRDLKPTFLTVSTCVIFHDIILKEIKDGWRSS